ncbi:MAG TPA: hypothetical protein VLA49_22350 [Anaerolineales bacterium]|nr:hypothetical protein [Anaerolineales bacterium]
MQIAQVDPRFPGEIKAFLILPFMIYKDITSWVPPLDIDTKRMIDHKRNPFFIFGEAAFFVAANEEQQIVGRVAKLNNHKYNSYTYEPHGVGVTRINSSQ